VTGSAEAIGSTEVTSFVVLTVVTDSVTDSDSATPDGRGDAIPRERLSIRTADLTATIVALPLGSEGGESGPLLVAAAGDGDDDDNDEEEEADGCDDPSRFVPSGLTNGTPF
jgi:hypothetical protein